MQIQNLWLSVMSKDYRFRKEESDDVDSEPEYNMQESISYFKCDVCEFECQREFTLNKHKNTTHNPKSRLGPGTFWVFNICKKRQA